MDKLEKLISDTFAIMLPVVSDVQPDNGICGLRKSAIKYLISKKKITCKLELNRFKQIQTAEQLEMFLQQYQLDDGELLSIYRDNFYNNGQL